MPVRKSSTTNIGSAVSLEIRRAFAFAVALFVYQTHSIIVPPKGVTTPNTNTGTPAGLTRIACSPRRTVKVMVVPGAVGCDYDRRCCCLGIEKGRKRKD
jgi:hypothetical protein